MEKHIRFLKKNFSLRINQFFAYKMSAFAQIISDLIGLILQPILAFIIYDISNGIPGWTVYELIFFNATEIISLGIAGSTFMAVLWEIGWQIDNGYFDLMLLKPLKMIPQMILRSINPWWISDILIGITILTFAVIKGGFTITISGLAIYLYLMLISGMIYYGVTATILGCSFKYFRAHRIMELFWTAKDLNKYPLSIYKGIIPFILTFIFPIAIANYYPVSFLLGKLTDTTIILALTIVCLSFAGIGTLMIKWGIKQYSSGGG